MDNIGIYLPKLNEHQFDRLSEIFGNLGIVFFASMVIPIFNKESDYFTTGVGIMLSLGFWVLSVYTLKKTEE